jgi:methylenetetrahydrofolate dehydrogenase (NADP+) / methenyltetrahydrofolate cyclohydrolase
VWEQKCDTGGGARASSGSAIIFSWLGTAITHNPPEPMAAQIISGNEVAAQILAELKEKVAALASEGLVPGLATVLVGTDPASHVYVNMKNKDARDLGLHSRQITLPAETSEDELLGLVQGLNADPQIHGILVQLPLPKHIDEAKVLLAIDPAKDVDGFHPVNVGRLSTGADDVLAPCTPRGVVEMLLRSGHDPAGKHCVVVGRSNIVGRPMASPSRTRAPGTWVRSRDWPTC